MQTEDTVRQEILRGFLFFLYNGLSFFAAGSLYRTESAFDRKRERRKTVDADFFLIQKMKRGDEEAIELFVRKYYPLILNYCRYHTYIDGTAEDLAQETFERFFRSFASYRHSGKLANYLYVIAGNLCRDSMKKRRDMLPGELPDPGEDPLDAVEGRLDLERAVEKLPEEMREVIILHYFQHLKIREVAEITGIGLPLAKYRIRKAKTMLKAYLGEEE